MSAGIVELEDATFDADVVNHDKPTLVDFWAEWCAPCRAIAPVVEQLAKEYEGRIQVGKMNIDHHPQVAGKYRIQAIPTLLLFKGGVPVEQIVGLANKAKLTELIEKHL